MKATGIVRRIDDLGRVVIPKEIRRTMRIREGDPLEIFTTKDGEVIFKKYSPIGELSDFAAQYAESIYKASGKICIITDKDNIIATAGAPKKELAERRIGIDAEGLIDEKTNYLYKKEKGEAIAVIDDNDKYFIGALSPIITEGDCIGCVIIAGEDKFAAFGEVEMKLAETAALFLGRQMEN